MDWRRAVTAALLVATSLFGLGSQIATAGPREPRPADVSSERLLRFRGVVSSRPEDNTGSWEISGRPVQVVEATRIDETQGAAEVGVHVMVVARRASTTNAQSILEAVVIQVVRPPPNPPVTIRGEVTRLDASSLVLDDIRILYDRSTESYGRLHVGAWVKVLAIRTDAGLKALLICVLPTEDCLLEFEGNIERIGHPHWVIEGRRVIVTRQTRIIGRPKVGLIAKVRAVRQPSGMLLALVIAVQNAEPLEVEWMGQIERMPPSVSVEPLHYSGEWVIEGRTVLVTWGTHVAGTPGIGLTAHVTALQYPGRPLKATQVRILSVEAAAGAPTSEE